MGAEAKATLKVGRQSYEGTAMLETDELRFRGDTRMRIALRDVSAVSATAGRILAVSPAFRRLRTSQ